MSTFDTDKTGAFVRSPCGDCHGTGELRIESENINENFEVQKQTLITSCLRCGGSGYIAPNDESTIVGTL
ncbi:hypothetical protein [Variovorax sp. PCZ-1]|uniref:hypothetical protein n=1 Tax=Variovorax sp. PCZ-1 TaxID=2835533 RepID=UPI001BCD5E0C|nr:hypothetical protein [Variovorax sp. PCZ-1]MBS7807657.1 hypothetical protein [Variovorax sp. PCZ-1]